MSDLVRNVNNIYNNKPRKKIIFKVDYFNVTVNVLVDSN